MKTIAPRRLGRWRDAAAALAAGLCCGLALAADGAPPAARSGPPPVEDFFRHPVMQSPQLSPSGNLLAVRYSKDDGRIGVAVLDLSDPSKSRHIVRFDNADVHEVHWVNDKRLVFNSTDLLSGLGEQRPAGLWAVDADGSNLRRLVRPGYEEFTTGTNIKSRELPGNHDLHSTLDDGSADVLVERANFNAIGELDHVTLLRLNTETGALRSLSVGAPEGARRWVADAKGQPRAMRAEVGGRSLLYWRDLASGQWTKISEDENASVGVRIAPYAVDEAGVFYVLANNHDAERTRGLYRYLVDEHKIEDKPLVSMKGFDFTGALQFDGANKRLLGVHFEGDAAGTVWLDAKMREIQEQVDKLLPATSNIISCRRCGESRFVLVTAASDRQSPLYLLYDTEKHTLDSVGAARPWLDARQMALRDFVTFKARDGLTIPMYVTKPRQGKGPWPAVVLVHGGPWVRGGHWEWDDEPQFLASRGYLVLQPEFRGSTGFGVKHYHAGFKQWGLAMQDDVADAARWAVQQGMADAGRMCIAGASYGGYATLMGLLRNPELFRCGVNWVGVTDIGLMYSITWSDTTTAFQSYGMPVMVGDRVKDARQLEETSPVKQADRIKQPILMAYGGSDRRVPITHGRVFRDAVTRTNPNVEWVEYPEEGHGFMRTKNQVDFWTRVEHFLDRNIGAGAEAAAAASK